MILMVVEARGDHFRKSHSSQNGFASNYSVSDPHLEHSNKVGSFTACFKVRFLPKTSYVSVVKTRVLCWGPVLSPVNFPLSTVFRNFYEVFFELVIMNHHCPLIRPAIRVYLKEGGVVSGGILKFPWSFVVFPRMMCNMTSWSNASRRRPDWPFYYYFWVTNLFLTTPPEKNEREHGSPWKNGCPSFCISFQKGSILRKPSP